MNILPASAQAVAVPAATDWVAVSKVVVIEIAFLSSLAAVLLGHSNQDITNIVWVTGATLGVLRLSDVAANIINVKSFLAKPDTGVVPQAAGTPLITTSTVQTVQGVANNASAPTP